MNEVRIRTIPAQSLGSEEERRWAEIQEADPALGSPYLRPEFARAVASVRTDAFVGVIEKGRRPLGFFPHHRRGAVGGPIGGRLCDCQAVVAEPDVAWTAEDLLRGCGLAVWDFDHLLATQTPFVGHHHTHAVSPVIDLSSGFEGWLDARRRAGTRRLRELARKRRKLMREMGPLRFVEHTGDPSVLERVITLKRAQCLRTGVVDFLSWGWTTALLRRIHATRTPGFEGVLSALYAGQELVAAHLGIRTRRVWHWWFPVYEERLRNYSPGGLLLLEIARRSEERGIGVIDLGKGDDSYKASFANSRVALAEGSVIRTTLVGKCVGTWRRARQAGERLVRTSPWVAPARVPLRVLRRRLHCAER